MTDAELLALVEAREAVDPSFAELVALRRDREVVDELSAGRTRPRSRLITERGVISALGPVEGEALLAGLEAFAAASLPPEHPLAAAHAGIARVIGWLKPPSDGVDIGDPLTEQLLGTLVALGTPGVTAERVAALLVLAREPDPVDLHQLSNVLSARQQ